jgi:hypothetical protein
MRFTIALIVAFAMGPPLACSSERERMQANARAANHQASISGANEIKNTDLPGPLPLRTLSDVPLTGGTTRLDYQSVDSENVFATPKTCPLLDALSSV